MPSEAQDFVQEPRAAGGRTDGDGCGDPAGAGVAAPGEGLARQGGEAASVAVSAGAIEAGRDVVITGTAGMAVPTGQRASRVRWLLAALAGVSLLTFLGFRWWPLPTAIPLRLDLETSYLRLRSAVRQPVFAQLPVESLSAGDLERIDLPDLGGGPIRRPEGSRRLGLRLEVLEEGGRSGSLTLEQSLLPAGAVVELRAGEASNFHLAVDALEEPLRLSVRGPHRHRLVLAGRKPGSWTAGDAAAPRSLTLTPRSGRLDLMLGTERPGRQELAPPIRIDGLWFHSLDRAFDGESTHLAELYGIQGGRLSYGGKEEVFELGQGAQLRLAGATGTLSALRLTGEGAFRFHFEGRAEALSRGPREQAVELRPVRSAAFLAIERLSLAFTVLNALLTLLITLLLDLPAVIRRARKRTRGRTGRAASNP